MSNYHKADCKVQWFQDDYPGAVMQPNCTCIHTTEGTSWPSYSGGAVAPNYTAHPNMRAKRLDWRAHFPDERSARALENDAGGVETNTLNIVQVELVGTCDPKHRHSWGGAKAGEDYIYWPDAPDWALQEVADFLRDQHKRHGLKLRAPKKFKAYPSSYGANGVRMSQRQWRNFYGVCGHQHVPENVHGDPGDIDIDTILSFAKGNARRKKRTRKPNLPHVNLANVQAAVAGDREAHKSIRRIQRALNSRYKVCLDVNGEYDDMTRAAYKVHQKEIGNPSAYCDGIPGPTDLEDLGHNRFEVTGKTEAKAETTVTEPKKHKKHKAKKPTRIENFTAKYQKDNVLDLDILERAVNHGRHGTVKHVLNDLHDAVARLPKK